MLTALIVSLFFCYKKNNSSFFSCIMCSICIQAKYMNLLAFLLIRKIGRLKMIVQKEMMQPLISLMDYHIGKMI